MEDERLRKSGPELFRELKRLYAVAEARAKISRLPATFFSCDAFGRRNLILGSGILGFWILDLGLKAWSGLVLGQTRRVSLVEGLARKWSSVYPCRM